MRDSAQDQKNALLSQKVEYLEKSLNDSLASQKDFEAKYNALRMESAVQLKEQQAKYEGQSKNLTFTINELNEKLLDYETRVSSDSQNWVKEKENYKGAEEKYKKSIEEANRTIDSLMKQVNEISVGERDRFQKMKKEFEETIETLTRKLESSESVLREQDNSVIILEINRVY